VDWFIATDEAGYGPKLGPLVIAATLWQPVSGAPRRPPAELFQSLLSGFELDSGKQLLFADSKKLFHQGSEKSLRCLEYPLLAALRQKRSAEVPADLRSLCRVLAPNDVPLLEAQPWYLQAEQPFPLDARGPAEAPDQWSRIDAWMARAEVRLNRIATRVIDVPQFNEGCARCGNKATLLSETTIRLVADTLERLDHQGQVEIGCDRHGGRAKYGAILQHIFPEASLSILGENAQQSRYELRRGGLTMRWSFTVGGDAFVPTALASIAAKYLRERLMNDWNAYWQKACGGGLRPTAGYPLDAARFLRDIEPTRRRLGIDLPQLVRQR